MASPKVKTLFASISRQNNIILEGFFDSGELTSEYGFVYRTGDAVPTIENTKIILGFSQWEKTFKNTQEKMKPGTYSFAAYMINSAGTFYGNTFKLVVPTASKIGSASLKQNGEFHLAGEVNERLPAVTNGLVYHFPFDATLRGKRLGKNLLDTSLWKVGTGGSQGYFGVNGIASEANIIEYKNPWGQEEPTWAVIKNDATSDADGGWNANGRPIDNTKKYRLSVWIKRENVGMGNTYFGCQASTVTSLKTTTVNTNPYFTSGKFPETYDDWALFVAYIHPHDYPDASDPTNGVYKRDGVRVRAVTDFKWTPTATFGGHRTYLYYTTDVDERSYWVRPRFEVCDGSEPSIAELLAGKEYEINPDVNSNNTLTDIGVALEEGTTNVWTGALLPYNNYGVPATLVKLDETYNGQPVYRLGMTVTDAHSSRLADFRTNLGAHGVLGGNLSWVQDTKYASSIYWRPVNKPDTIFGGTASNTGGWVAGPTEYLEDGWRRYTRYRTGVGIATKTDGIHHSFCCPSLQLNETIYIDFTCPQTEMGRTFATSYTPSTREAGFLGFPTAAGKSDFTITGEFIPNEDSNKLPNGAWFLNLGSGFLLRTYNGQPYIDGNVITGGSGSNVHQTFNTKPGVKVRFVITRSGETFTWRMKSADGQDKTWTITHSNVSTINVSGIYPSHTWGGRYKSLSIYNRVLAPEEINQLDKNYFSVKPSGDVSAIKIVEGLVNVPYDCLHFPMDMHPNEKKILVKPILESNTTYEEGAVWVGAMTKNLFNGTITTTTLDSDTKEGWHVVRPVGYGEYKRFHATPSQLTNNAIYTVSATVRNTMDKVVYMNLAWCGVDSFHTLQPYEMKRVSNTAQRSVYDANNSHADVGISPGNAVLVKDVQIEAGSIMTPFVAETRNYSNINYRGTDLTTNNWQEFSFFMTVKYTQSGVHRLSGAWSRWYFGLNTNDTLLFSWVDGTQKFVYSGTVIPMNTWVTIGVTVKNNVAIDVYYNGSRVGGMGTGFSLSSSSMDFSLNSIDANSTMYPINGWVRDMIFAPRALTAEEVKKMYKSGMSASKERLQISNAFKENQII